MLKNKKPKLIAGVISLLIILLVTAGLLQTGTSSSGQHEEETGEEETYSAFGEEEIFWEELEEESESEEPKPMRMIKESADLIITNSSELLGDGDVEALFTDIKKYIEGNFGLDAIGKLIWIFDEYQVDFSDHQVDGINFIDCSIQVSAHRASESVEKATEATEDEVETRSFPLALQLSESDVPVYPNLPVTAMVNYKLFKTSTPNEEYLPIEEKDLLSAFEKYESYASQVESRNHQQGQ